MKALALCILLALLASCSTWRETVKDSLTMLNKEVCRSVNAKCTTNPCPALLDCQKKRKLALEIIRDLVR